MRDKQQAKDMTYTLIPTVEGHYIVQVQDIHGEVYGYTIAENIEQATQAIVDSVNETGDNQIDIDFGEN